MSCTLLVDILSQVSIGFLLFAAVHTAMMAFTLEKRTGCFAFSIVCGCFVGYQALNLAYFHHDNLQTMVELLRWQTALIITAVYFFALTVYSLFSLTGRSRYLIGLAAACLLNLGLNFSLPFGSRFASVTGVVPIEFLQQPGSILAAQSGLSTYLFHALVGSLFIWIFYQFYQLPAALRRSKMVFAILLFVQFVASEVVGLVIDSQQAELLAISGFLFTPLVLLLSLFVSREFRRKEQQLQQEQLLTKQHQQRSHMLAQLVEQSPTATFVLNEQGHVVLTNEACSSFWGQSLIDLEYNMLALIQRLYPTQDLSVEALSSNEHLLLPELSSQHLPQVLRSALSDNCWIEFEVFVTRNSENHKIEQRVVLCKDVTERYYNQRAFEYMARGRSERSGLSFFDGMMQNLSSLFNVDVAFIATLDKKQQLLNTLSVYRAGEKTDNFSYELADSPCEQVLRRQHRGYASKLHTLFPDHKLTQLWDCNGYFGTPVLDEKESSLGVLVLLAKQPISNSQLLERTLTIFASRAGAEIQRHRAELRVEKVAYEDKLTRLPNRAAAHLYLNKTYSTPAEFNLHTCLFLVDIDQFKLVNDALGHDVGDGLLKTLGLRLRNSLPETIFIARSGGDAFIFISQHDPSTTDELGERIMALMHQPISVQEHLIDLSCSMGVAQMASGQQEASHSTESIDLISRAELALYQSKKEGRSGCTHYTGVLASKAKERMQMRLALKKAIEEQKLEVYFQPQLNQQGTLYGAEALIRWIDPEFGFISPARFVPIAEESGLIHQLGNWLNQQCLISLKRWIEQYYFKGHLSINVSAWQFALPDFADNLIEQLQAHNIEPHYLCIELTESGLLSDIDETIGKLNKLRSAGIHIALDDFGTGYSSLAYLRDFPIDILKIDKAFVDELVHGDHSPLAESMITIGHNMNLHVIAEGVENEQQVQQLSALNCDCFQGYFFARPMRESVFLEWLHEHKNSCTPRLNDEYDFD